MKQVENLPFNRTATISEIVSADYRTADIFRSHGIEFCCGGRKNLEAVCEEMQIDPNVLRQELEQATRKTCLPNNLNFNDWSIDFLTDYIINIHHVYLKKSLGPAKEYLTRFAEGHYKKYPFATELATNFEKLINEVLPHLAEEEEIIFPYIKHLSHAYNSKASYAGLLVRTLRKPVKQIFNVEHESVYKTLERMRELSDQYAIPENACPNHKVTFLKLKEIDNDLMQHLYLENKFLFPKAISMEKELLS